MDKKITKKVKKKVAEGAAKAAMEKLGSKSVATMKYNAPTQTGHSPAEMSPYKMESAKQEKYNLMHDNPVAKHASGTSWMSKHVHKMGGSPIKKHCM